jgi:Rrf2 family nitric oxide-sensitive transcriptional repressor
VECFNVEENTCPLGGVCSLQKILAKASRQFMKELDQYTLADLVPNRKKLKVALGQA